VEDLNLKDLTQKDQKNKYNFKNLRKNILNSSYSIFITLLEYKLAKRGKYLQKVEKRFPSSQCCSFYGDKNLPTKNLNNRSNMVCSNCGELIIDKDVNAAKNILFRGLKSFESPVDSRLKALDVEDIQYVF
jgi:putative transposase